MPMDPHLERFAELSQRDDASLRLDEAALEVARIGHPDLDAASCLEALDELAERTRSRRQSDEGVLGDVALLRRSLFSVEGFRGNGDDYYDPRNSYVNDVLERRVGIPITLSVIFLEVSRRLEIRAEGVGFPGHFLVRAWNGGRDWLLDPFDGGRILTEEDCQARVDRSLGVGVALAPQFVEGVGTRSIVARMLRNLKKIFLSRGDTGRTAAVLDRLVVWDPADRDQRRDRGKLRLSTGDILGAADDLETYLAAAGDSEDAHEVRGLLHRLRRRQAMAN